ncbi:hypothetical protein EDB89DRAFT_1911373 [Lactarius sanguifluus]|nr:hypothetical protein EDB89DRAFT_1911373 [Lactarius sanguifluus]
MNEKLAFGSQWIQVECQAVGLGDGRYRAISEMSRCERDRKARADEDWISDRRVRRHYYNMGVLVLLGRWSVQGNDGDGGWEYGIITPRRRKLRDKEGKETCALRRNRNFLSPALLEVLQVLKHVYKQGRLNCMVELQQKRTTPSSARRGSN